MIVDISPACGIQTLMYLDGIDILSPDRDKVGQEHPAPKDLLKELSLPEAMSTWVRWLEAIIGTLGWSLSILHGKIQEVLEFRKHAQCQRKVYMVNYYTPVNVYSQDPSEDGSVDRESVHRKEQRYITTACW